MTKTNIKHTILSLPIVGHTTRVIHNFFRSPDLYETVSKQASNIRSVREALKEIDESLAVVSEKLSSLSIGQDDLRHKFSILEQKTPGSSKVQVGSSKDSELFADDHVMDEFYTDFEDRFRGTEEMISARLEEYLPYFKNSKVNFKQKPVLDIGSGRGELLALLDKSGIASVGLDINHDMVRRSTEKGFNALQGDALSHLIKTKSQTYGAITGFHIVEHIPFNTLLRIFDNTHRCLAEDGFVIFETPNPENLTVGSTTFYMDPSHLHPLPPMLLAFALEFSGFRKVKILRIHPSDSKDSKGVTGPVKELLFGARDYAVIGYK